MGKPNNLYETDFNYKVFERERKIVRQNNEIAKVGTIIAVKLERKSDGMYIIDPLLNSFAKDELWASNISLNTQKTYIRVLCTFLNYCRYMISKKNPEFLGLKEGVFNLKFRHACLFLQEQVERYQVGEIKAATVLAMERPLLRYFQYLMDSGIVNENVNKVLDVDPKGNIKLVYNPFRQIGAYHVPFPKGSPQPQTVRDFSNDSLEDRIENIRLMINLSRTYYPDISFVLCIMFYAGLRLGEVVNLSRDCLERPAFYDDDLGQTGFVFNIKDNPDLFKGIKTKSNNQVKRTSRFAAMELLDIDFVSEVYRNHKISIERLERTGKVKNKKALFYSSQTGNPLTYNTAYYQFKELSDKFVNELVERGDKETLENLTDAETQEINITPHFCRAVFTNLGIDLGYTREQMKIRRGDNSTDAQEAYWNRKMVKHKRLEAVAFMQENSIEAYRAEEEK